MDEWRWAADPSRVHTEGRMARAALEGAREEVAGLLGVRPRQVVFTSSGTEAVNAAVWGATRRHEGRVIVPGVEHSAVTAASARHRPAETRVDLHGRVDLDHLKKLLSQLDVSLVHCQWANHEVGTLQPVAEAVELARANGVPIHVDACAAAGQVPLDLGALGADLVSVSAHKFGGPPGIGALVVGRGQRFDPLIVGGAQERGRRAGMENVAAAAGFGAAAAALDGDRLKAEAAAARSRTERILQAAGAIEGVMAYGDVASRLPHIVCLGIDGVEAEGVLLGLDQGGVAVHSGSACSSEELEPSPVLQAMGVDASHSLRLSVGWSTTDADIDALAVELPAVVERLRSLGPRPT